jgi:hypothetical protein
MTMTNMAQQFWVVGGEFRDTSFSEIVDGEVEAFGPFPSYDTALQLWKERSQATRPLAHVRYTIAVNNLG